MAPVLLVEPVGNNNNGKLRSWLMPIPAPNPIIERCHMEAGYVVRTWVNRDGECAQTGQLIYREELPPPPKEEAENPVFQETKLKKPIPLGVDKQTFDRIGARLNKFRK